MLDCAFRISCTLGNLLGLQPHLRSLSLWFAHDGSETGEDHCRLHSWVPRLSCPLLFRGWLGSGSSRCLQMSNRTGQCSLVYFSSSGLRISAMILFPLQHIHACMHTCKHACMNAYMHTCIHANMHAWMHTCIHAYIHTYIHACMHACMHTYIQTDIHTYIHACMHACMHACIHAYMHTCLHACMHEYMRTSKDTSIHT